MRLSYNIFDPSNFTNRHLLILLDKIFLQLIFCFVGERLQIQNFTFEFRQGRLLNQLFLQTLLIQNAILRDSFHFLHDRQIDLVFYRSLSYLRNLFLDFPTHTLFYQTGNLVLNFLLDALLQVLFEQLHVQFHFKFIGTGQSRIGSFLLFVTQRIRRLICWFLFDALHN